MTKMKKAENIKCWQRWGTTIILVHCWWQSVTTLKEDLLVFFQKTKHKSILWSAIRLLVVYPREVKAYIYKEPCRRMFIAALLIIAPNLETAQMSISNRSTDTYRELALNKKKEQTAETGINMDESQKRLLCIVKAAVYRRYILYLSI